MIENRVSSQILFLDDICEERNLTIGEKAQNLSISKKHGVNVPDGIVLTAEYLDRITKHLTYAIPQGDTESIDIVAKYVQSDHAQRVNNEILTAVSALKKDNQDKKYAVRSAAIGEDGKNTSFAGQFDTYLNISEEGLLVAVIKCLLSRSSTRATSYRKHLKELDDSTKMSIIIQEMVTASFSGVLFTQNPVTKEKTIIIEAVKGLGDVLVSGKIIPEYHWEIRSFNTSEPVITEKVKNCKIAPDRGILLKLAGEAIKLEKIFHEGLDIEWAIKDENVFILQVRPITGTPIPLLKASLTKGIFCRTIIEDLWSDKMTNITSSIVFNELSGSYTFKKPFRTLNLKEFLNIDSVRVYGGYGYLNTEIVAMLLEYIPKKFRFREIANSFHPSTREHILETRFARKKVWKILPRLFLLLKDPAVVPFLTKPVLLRHQQKIKKHLLLYENYENKEFAFFSAELERLIKLLACLQNKNQWGYGYASLTTWLTRHIVIKYSDNDEAWLLERLRNLPENVTLKIHKHLTGLCERLDQKTRADILSTDNKQLAWKSLINNYPDHPLLNEVRSFLKLYKFRASNRDFIHKRWDEKPELILEHVSIILKGKAKQEGYVHPVQKTKTIKQFFLQSGIYFLLFFTKKFISLREDLRFSLDICFYKIRQLLIAISNHPDFKELKNEKDWIFFLELNELRKILKDSKKIEDYMKRIPLRKQLFYKDIDLPPPYHIYADKDNYKPFDISTASKEAIIIKGIAASAGIAEGIVKIIRNETEFSKIESGNILVAFNTDPGWTPVFHIAKGVIVEMGGILNHCSIVAREYGIPAIVGIPNITRILKENQKIRMNGHTGVIEVIQ